MVSQLNDLTIFFYTTNNSGNILTYTILHTRTLYGNNFDRQRVEIFGAVLTVREFSGGKATLI